MQTEIPIIILVFRLELVEEPFLLSHEKSTIDDEFFHSLTLSVIFGRSIPIEGNA